MASNPWREGRLKVQRGHFMGEQHEAGSLVQYRNYEPDPSYLEVRLPDGFYYTADPSDIEPGPEKEGQKWTVY